MSASFTLDGVAELRAAIAAAGPEVRAEVLQIIQQAAAALAQDLQTQYPVRQTNLMHGAPPGALRRGVRVVPPKPGHGSVIAARVRSNAPHAHLYEFGTVRRKTGRGAYRGVMPEADPPVFVPTAVRARDAMLATVAAALRRLRVDGFTGTPEVTETP